MAGPRYVTRPGIRDKLGLAAEAAVLCHSSLAQLMVREYLATQPWRKQVKTFRELYRERRDAMLDTLGAVGGLPVDTSRRRVLRLAIHATFGAMPPAGGAGPAGGRGRGTGWGPGPGAGPWPNGARRL